MTSRTLWILSGFHARQLVAHHFLFRSPRAEDPLPLKRGGVLLVCRSLCSPVVSVDFLCSRSTFQLFVSGHLIPCHPTSLPLRWVFPGAPPCARCCRHDVTLLRWHSWWFCSLVCWGSLRRSTLPTTFSGPQSGCHTWPVRISIAFALSRVVERRPVLRLNSLQCGLCVAASWWGASVLCLRRHVVHVLFFSSIIRC